MSIQLIPRRICTPAMIYLILAIIQVISGLVYGTMHLLTVGALMLIVVILLWTWLLDFVCKAGYPIISWILVILPILLMTLAILYFSKWFMTLPVEKQQKVITEIKEIK